MECTNKPHQPNCFRCKSTKTKRDGVTIKGAQRYLCHDCGCHWQSHYVRSYVRRSKHWHCMDQRSALFQWASQYPAIQSHLFTVTQLPAVLHWRTEAGNQDPQCTVLLAYPSGLYHGLWINLYHPPSMDCESAADQYWLHAVQAAGYAVSLSHRWQQAVNDIQEYLK